MSLRVRGFLIPLLAAAFVVWAAGCSSDSTTNPTQGSEVDLDAPFGGMDAGDEAPAFGDADLAASEDSESSYDDPMALDLLMRAWESDAHSLMYAVTIRWGFLESSESPGAVDSAATMNWDGSLSITTGALRIVRLLGFEEGDEILPREDRSTVAWQSTTQSGADGIRLLVIVPPEGQQDPNNLVQLDVGPVEEIFQPEDLEDLEEVIDVDDAGHQVAIRAFLAPPAVDVRGFTSGRWEKAPGDTLGTFAGRWLSLGRRGDLRDYTSLGFVRGYYGTDSEGIDVFYGKIIDRTGRFQGFLQGTWRVDQENEKGRVGVFEGEWVNEDGAHMGSVRGTWRQAASGVPGSYGGAWTRD